MGAAYLLHRQHDITLYEKAQRIGGHTRTITVDYAGHSIPVDTGFIVFNERNYPHLTALFRHLDVQVHASDMTFAATIADGRLEWGAKNLNAIFGQRRNLLRPRFYRLLREVGRFNERAPALVERCPDLTLAELLTTLGLGEDFRNFYILPMASAIWSCSPRQMLAFPASSFVRFFANHGLLSTTGQPHWYTVTGGSQEYVKRLTQPFVSRIRAGCTVVSVTREQSAARVVDSEGHAEVFDRVVFACHGDQALAMMTDADAQERETLGAFAYQKNRAVLHRDQSFMPKRRRCWASWVYHSDGQAMEPAVSLTYWMNRLQGIDAKYPLFVTLNPQRPVDEELIFDEHEFEHPVFTQAAIKAQARLAAMQGYRSSWFCGAYLRNGFHEDGLMSAVEIASRMRVDIPWTRYLPYPVPPVPEWKPDLMPSYAFAPSLDHPE